MKRNSWNIPNVPWTRNTRLPAESQEVGITIGIWNNLPQIILQVLEQQQRPLGSSWSAAFPKPISQTNMFLMRPPSRPLIIPEACEEITFLTRHFNSLFFDISETWQVRTRRGGVKRLKMSHSTTRRLDLNNKSQAIVFPLADAWIICCAKLSGLPVGFF